MLAGPEAFFATLRSGLLGHAVSFCRLACDSLLLYVDCDPGDPNGITIWFEPVWHLCGPGGVLLGSMQIAEACITDTEEAMAAVADEPLAPLLGRRIERIAIDPVTFDLGVSFEGGYGVSTFVTDATDDESWHIRENATGTRLKGSPRGFAVVQEKRSPR